MLKTLISKARQDYNDMYSLSRDRCLIARSEIKNLRLLEDYLERIKIVSQKETTFMHVVGFFVGNYTTYCPKQSQLNELDNLIDEELEDSGVDWV